MGSSTETMCCGAPSESFPSAGCKKALRKPDVTRKHSKSFRPKSSKKSNLSKSLGTSLRTVWTRKKLPAILGRVCFLRTMRWLSQVYQADFVPKEVCLVDALRSLGFNVPYVEDGPFRALTDGNRFLQPFQTLDCK